MDLIKGNEGEFADVKLLTVHKLVYLDHDYLRNICKVGNDESLTVQKIVAVIPEEGLPDDALFNATIKVAMKEFMNLGILCDPIPTSTYAKFSSSKLTCGSDAWAAMRSSLTLNPNVELFTTLVLQLLVNNMLGEKVELAGMSNVHKQ